MAKNDIVGINEKYQISDDFHPHAPRQEDRVISSLVNDLAMYEEDLHAGLCFPLHNLIWDILHQYDVVPT